MSIHFRRLVCSLLSFRLFLIVIVGSFWNTAEIMAQCSTTATILSSNGYELTIDLTLAEVVVLNNACPSGFNYGINVAYDIHISDPSVSMYTLQGNVLCENGGDETFFDLPNGGGVGFDESANNWKGSCYSNPPNPSPADLGCFTYRLQIEGPGIPYQTITVDACQNASPCVEEIQISELERVYIYRCDGAFTVPSEFDDAEVFLVAGGGGGGYGGSSGGGGGGGVAYSPSVMLTSGANYPVFVGKGGLGASTANAAGQNGMNSYFAGLTAHGGGGGGSYHPNQSVWAGRAGGSGGGHASNSFGTTVGYSGSTQGTGGATGGQGNGEARSGGGGGGFGSSGLTGQGSSGGGGGTGASATILSDIESLIGFDNLFAAGGGGTGRPGQGNNQGAGGSNIGGDASTTIGQNGQANTGSGGGAGWTGGGSGADGMVIIRLRLSSLPVEWKSFHLAYLFDLNAVKLNWSVYQENEIAYYEVERSIDGIDDFQVVGKVTAKGWSREEVSYEFLDHTLPFEGGKMYYRIKQLSLNGSEGYSEVFAVNIPEKAPGKQIWQVYPNPANGEMATIRLMNSSMYADEPIQFRLVSSVYSTSIYQCAGEVDFSATFRNVHAGLPRGLWILEVTWGDHIEHIKVVKN